jgi:hypothetical protein
VAVFEGLSPGASDSVGEPDGVEPTDNEAVVEAVSVPVVVGVGTDGATVALDVGGLLGVPEGVAGAVAVVVDVTVAGSDGVNVPVAVVDADAPRDSVIVAVPVFVLVCVGVGAGDEEMDGDGDTDGEADGDGVLLQPQRYGGMVYTV